MANEEESTLFLKEHDSWCRTVRVEPMFPADMTAGVVCIVRNPLDIAPALAHHPGVDIAGAFDRLCGSTDGDGLTAGYLSGQLRWRLVSCTDHVRSWVDESAFPVPVVPYEGLHADAQEVFLNVVRFTGLDELHPELATRPIDAHGETMARLGYEAPSQR